jgi:hypothetical protein
MIKYYNLKFKSNKWLTIYSEGQYRKRIVGKRNFCQIAPNKKEATGTIENKHLIFQNYKSNLYCYYDLSSLFPNDWGITSQFYEELRKPQFHTIYLSGKPILTLNRDKLVLFIHFQLEISSSLCTYIPEGHNRLYGIKEYEYMRGLFGLPTATEEEKREYTYPPMRRIIKTSLSGHEYVAKRALPSNFAKLVYGECVRHNNPYILLFVMHYYMGDGDINSRLFGD